MCRALALPMATGFTASKCDGFGNIVTWQPFTSTELAEIIKNPSNCISISLRDFSKAILHSIDLTKKKCEKNATNSLVQNVMDLATLSRGNYSHQQNLLKSSKQIMLSGPAKVPYLAPIASLQTRTGRVLTNPNVISYEYDNMYVCKYIYILPFRAVLAVSDARGAKYDTFA